MIRIQEFRGYHAGEGLSYEITGGTYHILEVLWLHAEAITFDGKTRTVGPHSKVGHQHAGAVRLIRKLVM
jgi:hypothetical protein